MLPCSIWVTTDMKLRVQSDRAYVLHSRPYQETSLLLEVLTCEHGLVSLIAKGVRRAGRRPRVIAPFNELQLGFSGRGMLYTLTGCETLSCHWLQGEALYAGLYLNEISLRLLQHLDAHPALFAAYAQAIQALAAATPLEPVLRQFEKHLLRESGYELLFDQEADSGAPVQADQDYRFLPEQGFVRVAAAEALALQVPGAVLLAIAADDYRAPEVRRYAKQIMRQALAPLLGARGLHSRALFAELGQPVDSTAVAPDQP